MNGGPLRVLQARDLGPQFIDNPHRMVGQDGAFSFPLPDGCSFWFFGDTLIGTRPVSGSPWVIDGKLVDHRDMTGLGGYQRMINNCGLILPRQSGSTGLRGYRYVLDGRGEIRCLIPLEAGENPDWDRIWCQGGIAIGGQIVLSFIQVRMLEQYAGPLPIGFDIVGSGLAAGELQTLEFKRIRRDGTHILFKAHEPHFGVSFLPHGDWVYVYGTAQRAGSHSCYVARCALGRVTEPECFEFFAGGRGWSGRLADAAPIFGQMPSELSVSFNGHLGCYLAVHSLDLTGALVGRTAPHPWGPWSEPTLLWQVQDKPLGYRRPYPFPLIYAGKEHPQLSPDGGRTIYLTYVEFEEYFPHLIEVVLQ